ncbi:VCBS repeat-containing protein [Ilyomonas limi]|uniref:VCBS repeat-containing protein n=1 Tax=Ilyomonas limi TaxID=2575867 RepID=A0A4V6XAY9_9BACT|nr:VCBS repeat-containing protein [Ilyomonas limi]TKK71853.1 VCBS repeat-containing protein [Ilyomonas limi]
MNKYLLFFFSLLVFSKGMAQISFRKQMIAAESFESVNVFDVNNDGKTDIVSGAFWYEGPNFITRHFIGNIERTGPTGEYWADFATIPLDVNGDGKMDFVSGDWFSKCMWWWENPGNNEQWKKHIIDTTGNVECIRAWDVDGDGTVEIVPNNPGSSLKFYKLQKDKQDKSTGKFLKVEVTQKQDHGVGFGDINGDGRGDFVISDGWIEAPADRINGKWILHKEFTLGTVSVPVLIEDVNKDSKMDLIVGQGHDYGLDWYEQKTDQSAKRIWVKHPIDPFHSQYHTMEWADIDNDGQMELITGKRYRAHNGADPGGNDLSGLYYFKWNGESFTKNIISYGPLGEGKGTGLFFAIADLHHTGRKDIIVAGKDGLYVFYNEGL